MSCVKRVMCLPCSSSVLLLLQHLTVPVDEKTAARQQVDLFLVCYVTSQNSFWETGTRVQNVMSLPCTCFVVHVLFWFSHGFSTYFSNEGSEFAMFLFCRGLSMSYC